VAGSIERVKQHLESNGLHVEFREFLGSTKNSVLAARALGCSVAEIAKSVVFNAGGPVVVVISGDRRVDPIRLELALGRKPEVATPEEVRSMTGYSIGGVPPFPHNQSVRVLLDRSLGRFERVWAAGGAPDTVFRIRTEDLIATLGGNQVDVAEPFMKGI